MADLAMPQAPSLRRRLACFIYEGLLLFGVSVAVGLLYSPLMQQRNALDHRQGLMFALGLAYALYFGYFWTHGGQTLAMKTWRLRLIRVDGSELGAGRALQRFVLSLMWWALPLASTLQLRQWGLGIGPVSAVAILGILGYALLSRRLPGRQFAHDLLSGTALVDHQPIAKKS